MHKDHQKSYQLALACDPISAFGGIVSCNYKINKNLAIELNKVFLEVVIANGFEKEAFKILKKKKNLRIINANDLSFKNMNNFISNFNSILIQSSDINPFVKKNFKIVSKKKPSTTEFKNLIFAFNICRFVKSNAIVLAKDNTTVGIGSGQSSRLDSCKIAINKMNQFQKIQNNDGVVAASDAFFPFVDGIETLVQAGISAVIQPSGSIRDKEIIKFANQTGTILVFSKTRHFKH
jgi:phosphoribosylaminoimidazolecarboxamide formyltransferase/IMP cyclohydrolase